MQFLCPSHWESDSLQKHLDKCELWKVGKAVVTVAFFFSLICSCICAPVVFPLPSPEQPVPLYKPMVSMLYQEIGPGIQREYRTCCHGISGRSLKESGNFSIHGVLSNSAIGAFSFGPLSYYARNGTISN